MITTRNAENAPAALRRRLEGLAVGWPVGTTVKHVNGWTGEVVHDTARRGGLHDLTGHPDAHALDPTGWPVVCVRGTYNGVTATAWYTLRVLTRVAPGPVRPARRRARSSR